MPVTIDVVKQLTVDYQAWKENRISEEQLQQLNIMPIDANTGLVWWQVRRCPPRAAPSPIVPRVASLCLPRPIPRRVIVCAVPRRARAASCFVCLAWRVIVPPPVAAVARLLTRVYFGGRRSDAGAGGGRGGGARRRRW